MKKITLKPFSLKAYRMVLPNTQNKRDKKSIDSSEPSKRNHSQKCNKTHLTIPKLKTYKKLKSLKNELIKQTLNNFNSKPNLNLSLTITNDIARPPLIPKKRGNYIYHNYRNKHMKTNKIYKKDAHISNSLTEPFCNNPDKQSILNYFSKYDNSISLYSILAKERNKFKMKFKNVHNKKEGYPTLIKSKARPNTPNNKKIFHTVFKEIIYDDIIPLNDCHYRTKTENERYIKYMEDLRFIQHLVLESPNKEQAENYVLCFLNENRIFEFLIK